MAIKHTNIFLFKALQNLPKLGFLVLKHAIWQPWNYVREISEKSLEKSSGDKERFERRLANFGQSLFGGGQ
jgi:hypothetical protein